MQLGTEQRQLANAIGFAKGSKFCGFDRQAIRAADYVPGRAGRSRDGGQVPRHHKPSSRPHARLVAQFPVHERFVALGSHYHHLRTRLDFSPSALVRDSGQHTHAKTTTCKLLFANFVHSGGL